MYNVNSKIHKKVSKMHKNYTFIAPTEYYLKECPELLFVQYDKDNRNTPIHAHDFWQFELVVSGSLEVKSSQIKLKAIANDCILIPPGIPHRMIFANKDQSSWSVKFKLETRKILNKIIILDRSTESMNTRNNILQIFNEFNTSSNSYIILQYLLGMLIELEFQRETISADPNFITQVKELLDSYEGRPITINELADKLEYSRNSISKKFHTATGIKLKSFIDSRRVQIAARMLLYSDQKIITISEIMGFTDVYSFSRFFRRHKGYSPRQYRTLNKMT
jgi:AraC family transcriptional activator of pobA